MLNFKPLPPDRAQRQRGVTLIEALVALLVMSFGMMALVGLMGNLRRGADLAKQRGEAVRLAQTDLETLRSYSELPTSTDPKKVTFDGTIVTNTRTVTPADSNASFTVSRFVSPIKMGDDVVAKAVRVMVTWTDRAGESGSTGQPSAPQSVTLDTVIARVDPGFSGSLEVQPPPGGIRQPAGRHPVIPVTAKDLGNKQSAFRPSALGSVVWVFNNVTGAIVSKCSIEAGTPVSTLTAADVESCDNSTIGYLLNGTVRFSNTDPANPAIPEASAIPLDLAIVGGTYMTPLLGPDGRPVKDGSGNVIMTTVTVTPPSYQCFNDSPSITPSTQPFVNYNCIVYPTDGVWSGKVTLSGFSIGTTAVDYRVCRYSADYNGNGSPNVTNTTSLDNYEHPELYVKVAGSLARQNFLVVRGTRTCPTAPAVNPTSGIFVDYSTIQLQP